MGHFYGRVNSWDVVNEALAYDCSGRMADNVYLKKLGPGYVEDCFRVAHQVGAVAVVKVAVFSAVAVAAAVAAVAASRFCSPRLFYRERDSPERWSKRAGPTRCRCSWGLALHSIGSSTGFGPQSINKLPCLPIVLSHKEEGGGGGGGGDCLWSVDCVCLDRDVISVNAPAGGRRQSPPSAQSKALPGPKTNRDKNPYPGRNHGDTKRPPKHRTKPFFKPMKIDPNAKLIYNDNKVEGAGLPGGRSRKADAMYDMLKGKPRPRRRVQP